MKKYLLFHLVFVVFFVASNSYLFANVGESIGEFKPSKKKTLPKRIYLEDALLWEITGKNLTQPSYLFGTIHTICEDDMIWFEEFQNALAASDEIVFEIGAELVIEYFEEKFNPEILKLFKKSNSANTEYDQFKSLIQRNNKSLKDKVPFKRIKRGSDGKSIQNFRNRIMGGSLALTEFFLQQNKILNQCDNQTSYEVKLIEKGIVLNKNFDFLETVEEQIEALNSTNDSYRTTKDKLSVINDEKPYEEKLNELVSLYINQNISKLYEFMIEPTNGLVDLDAIIFDRNINWIQKLNHKLVPGKTIFIAVGAGHFGSELGLIQLLRDEGYTLTPIKTKKQ